MSRKWRQHKHQRVCMLQLKYKQNVNFSTYVEIKRRARTYTTFYMQTYFVKLDGYRDVVLCTDIFNAVEVFHGFSLPKKRDPFDVIIKKAGKSIFFLFSFGLFLASDTRTHNKWRWLSNILFCLHNAMDKIKLRGLIHDGDTGAILDRKGWYDNVELNSVQATTTTTKSKKNSNGLVSR